MFVNENLWDWSAGCPHSNWTLDDCNDCLDAVVDGLIGFIWEAGIAGADVNSNLEVFGRVDDTFAVDVGGFDFGGGDEVDDADFVSPVNEDIMSLLWFSIQI